MAKFHIPRTNNQRVPLLEPRIVTLTVMMFAVLAIAGVRLYYLQVLHHQDNVEMADRNRIRLQRVPAPFSPSNTVKSPGAIEKVTSFKTLRGPKLCPSPATEKAGVALMPASRTGHHTPGQLSDRHRLDYLERPHVDHRNVVADPVRRVNPALVRVEGEAPYPLSD